MYPNTSIVLCNVPTLGLNYQHTFDFGNLSSQLNFFQSKAIRIFNDCLYQREHKNIRVESYIEDIHLANYLYFTNNNKTYYAFITKKRYIHDMVTEIEFEIDVMQTYLFDYKLETSFIERCHVDRWDKTNNEVPTLEITDEGLDIGSYEIEEIEKIYKFQNNYIISSSVPLGVLKKGGYDGNAGTGGGTDEECGDWKNGILSAKAFRFIKGFEAFASEKYQDSEGYWTIAYGITLHGEADIYNELVAEQPISEERAAKVSYKLKIERYGKAIVDAVKKLGCNKQCQFDALLSVAYNSGNYSVIGSNSLTRAIALNPENEEYIRPIWENFKINAGTSSEAGLRARRKEECNMYFNKGFEVRPILTIKANGNYGTPVTENNGDGWLPKCITQTGDYELEGLKWKYPCNGTVTALFPYYSNGGTHTGIDIASSAGTPIYATRDGVVVDAQYLTSSYGYHLRIEHDGYIAIYAHNSELLVKKGDKVKQGQIIARMGNTGNSTGVHLHYELRKNGIAINPISNLKIGQKI